MLTSVTIAHNPLTARNMQVINIGKKGPADPNTVAVATVNIKLLRNETFLIQSLTTMTRKKQK